MKYALVLAAVTASLVSALPQQADEAALTKLPWKSWRGYGDNIPGCLKKNIHDFNEDCDGTMTKCLWYILWAKEYKSTQECIKAHEDQPEADRAHFKAVFAQRAAKDKQLKQQEEIDEARAKDRLAVEEKFKQYCREQDCYGKEAYCLDEDAQNREVVGVDNRVDKMKKCIAFLKKSSLTHENSV